MHNKKTISPLARKENLVIQELDNEVLVYNLKTHQVHCLNETTALVWSKCDGKSTAENIARLIEQEKRIRIDVNLIYLALEGLDEADLLESNESRPKITRRDAIRLATSTALALPLITSIVAPTAAQAATCRSNGASCTSSAQCCSGLCGSNVCVPT